MNTYDAALTSTCLGSSHDGYLWDNKGKAWALIREGVSMREAAVVDVLTHSEELAGL